MFRIIKGIDKLDIGNFFELNSRPSRYNSLKLIKPRALTSHKQFSFSHRVINNWNELKIDDEGNSTRQLIIRRAKELRQSNAWNNIFIVPDQTPNERELREELKTRRSAGEINLTIRRSRIVSKSAVTENKTRANHGTIQPPQLLTLAIDQGEIVTAK